MSLWRYFYMRDYNHFHLFFLCGLCVWAGIVSSLLFGDRHPLPGLISKLDWT